MPSVPPVTVRIGPPRMVQRAWLEWAQAHEDGFTLTPVAPLAAHLTTQACSAGVAAGHRVVCWDHLAAGAYAAPRPVLPLKGLVPRLAKALTRQEGPWRGRLGAAAAVAETVLRLRREGVPAERLERLRGEGAVWVQAGYRAVDALLEGAVEASRVRWVAADGLARRMRGVPVAWYGTFPGPAAAGAAAPLAAAAPSAVFVPRAGGPADAALVPWVRWWLRRGARVVALDDDEPAAAEGLTVPARGLVAAAVADAVSQAGTPGTLVATFKAETAELLRAGLDGAGGRVRDRWLLAWEAADRNAPFAAVLAWLGAANRVGPAERRAVARAGPWRERWPPAVQEAWRRLVEARDAVLAAADWRAAGRAVDRLAAAAGFPSPLTEEDRAALAAWDAVGTLAPTPDHLAWWVTELGHESPGDGLGVGPWSAFAGGFFERLVVVVEPGGFDDEGPASPLLDSRSERLLGLWSTSARQRWLGAVLERSARHVLLIRTAGQSWPRRLRPPSEQAWQPAAGPGLVRPRVERADAFPPGAVTPPRTVTHFEWYGRCPLAYAWERLGFEPLWLTTEEPAADLVGLWLHEALARVAGEPPEARDRHAVVVQAVNAALARHPAPPAFWGDVVAGVAEGLVADIVRYLLDPVEGRVVATEWPFEIALAGVRVAGRVDRVERRGETWWVVDFKSGRLPPARVGPGSLQFAVYAQAVAAAFGVRPETVRAEFVGVRHRTNQHQRRTPDGDAALWLRNAMAVVTGVVERVVRGQLPPFPEPGACRSCPWRVACPTGVEAGRTRLADRDPVFAALWDTERQGADPGDDTA
jgi:hypothetical protein